MVRIKMILVFLFLFFFGRNDGGFEVVLMGFKFGVEW